MYQRLKTLLYVFPTPLLVGGGGYLPMCIQQRASRCSTGRASQFALRLRYAFRVRKKEGYAPLPYAIQLWYDIDIR